MDDITPVVATEVVGILYNSEASIVSKIPYKILESLEDESNSYQDKDNLISKISVNNHELSDEAKALMAIIYKDYLCESQEEKELLTTAFVQGLQEHEQEQKEKFNPFKEIPKSEIEITGDGEFSRGFEEKEKVSTVTSLSSIPKKWYIKLFDKIKSFF